MLTVYIPGEIESFKYVCKGLTDGPIADRHCTYNVRKTYQVQSEVYLVD